MTTADEILNWAWKQPDRGAAERLARGQRCLQAIRHVADLWLAHDKDHGAEAAMIAICALLGEAGR